MEGSLLLEINFNDTVSSDHIVVTESTVYGFFSCRSFRSRSHYPFSIKSLKGPIHVYKKDSLDINDNIAVSFIFPKGDERPFVLILQKSTGKKFYYKVKSFTFYRWSEIDELNGISEEMQEKLLLDTYKQIFVNYYDSTLRINEAILLSRSYTYFETKYDISTQVNYCDGYDRYHFIPDKSHSVSMIYVNDQPIKLDKITKFVKDFYFYYAYYDMSMPLLIETYDYKFDNELPLYNYYVREAVNSDQWVSVECASNLIDQKCKSDIKRILDMVQYHHKMKRVLLDIKNPKEHITSAVTKFVDGIPFTYDAREDIFYGCYSYQPNVSKLFLLDNITINGEKQIIDIHSLQVSIIYVYYTLRDPDHPLMVSLGLYNHINGMTSQYYWYKRDNSRSNLWERIEFYANPEKDVAMIEDKMKELYDTKSSMGSLYSALRWMGVFSLGCLIGTYFGVKFSRRIVFNTIRVYHRLRGYNRLRD